MGAHVERRSSGQRRCLRGVEEVAEVVVRSSGSVAITAYPRYTSHLRGRWGSRCRGTCRSRPCRRGTGRSRTWGSDGRTCRREIRRGHVNTHDGGHTKESHHDANKKVPCLLREKHRTPTGLRRTEQGGSGNRRAWMHAPTREGSARTCTCSWSTGRCSRRQPWPEAAGREETRRGRVGAARGGAAGRGASGGR